MDVQTVAAATTTTKTLKNAWSQNHKYYYDKNGYLRSEHQDVRKLFHQLSRAKEELALVVKENETVYAVLLNLLQGRK